MLDAKRMRQLRQEKGMTVEEAARRAGMSSKGHWSDIENANTTDIRISTLEKIARTLGVKPGDLLKIK